MRRVGRAWVSGFALLAVFAFLLRATLGAPSLELAGYAQLKHALRRLQVLGSVLMIAAHPDDENTALLAYLARGRHFRVGYLSLTRGEGGQNLIGPEQGALLGLVRTQELLAARRIDGAEQYFTRAVDFGYSKSAEETLRKWGREEILSDIVWVIRQFRPDVVILRFSGTSRDGHGHHQASAILGQQAAQMAADPGAFPEQLRWVTPWRPKRVVWNTFAFGRASSADAASAGRIEIDVGDYEPILGLSFGEMAGLSRSMHRSQGFGSPLRRGPIVNSFLLVTGEPAAKDLFDGIDTTWNRVPGGGHLAQLLAQAEEELRAEQPHRIVPLLLQARQLMSKLQDPWARIKEKEVDEAIAMSLGLWLDARTPTPAWVPGESVEVEFELVNRSPQPVTFLRAQLATGEETSGSEPLLYNRPLLRRLSWRVPSEWSFSRPYWFTEEPAIDRYPLPAYELLGRADDPPLLVARFWLRVLDSELCYERPVLHRYVDRARGELTQMPAVVPPVSIALPGSAIVFPTSAPRTIPVRLRAQRRNVSGVVRLKLPAGWRVEPVEYSFRIEQPGEEMVVDFIVDPPATQQVGTLEAAVRIGEWEFTGLTRTIAYPHFPVQTFTVPSRVRLVRVDAVTLARKVGYIMGAGDEVPEALRQLGCEVKLLEASDLAAADLSQYDAIVTGVRAFNVRPDLRAHFRRLLEYVQRGGTLVVQYNVVGGGPGAPPEPPTAYGPYRLVIGRERVTDETTPVQLLDPDHPILQRPNRITDQDFEGWVQERGLYFASEWDERYQPLFAMADPGESPLRGSTLVAQYGKGVYIFSALAWFRQLPAGVPGAYRIFANFLSAGRIVP